MQMVEAYQYRTYTAHTNSTAIVQILRIPSLQNQVLLVACSDHIRMCSQLTMNLRPKPLCGVCKALEKTHATAAYAQETLRDGGT